MPVFENMVEITFVFGDTFLMGDFKNFDSKRSFFFQIAAISVSTIGTSFQKFEQQVSRSLIKKQDKSRILLVSMTKDIFCSAYKSAQQTVWLNLLLIKVVRFGNFYKSSKKTEIFLSPEPFSVSSRFSTITIRTRPKQSIALFLEYHGRHSCLLLVLGGNSVEI